MAYVTTATVTGTIRYRFTCEQCGETTPWYTISVTRKGGANGTGEAASEAAYNVALNSVHSRFGEIRKDTEEGRYPAYRVVQGGDDEDLFRRYECPQCNAVQSWGVRAAEQKIGKLGLYTLLFISAYVIFFALSANFFPSVANAVWDKVGAWMLWIVPIILIAGLVADSIIVKRELRKNLEGQSNDIKNLPEIDWNVVIS